MDILFCDICNESVPQPDLAHGRAVVRGARVVCAQCEAAMGRHLEEGGGGGPHGGSGFGAGELALAGVADVGGGVYGAGRADAGAAERRAAQGPAAGAGAGAGVGAFIGLVALSVAAASAWLLVERIDGLERSHGGQVAQLEQELDAARRARASGAAELGAQVAEVSAETKLLAASIDGAIARGTEDLAAELAAATAREADIRRELESARARVEEVLSLARLEREAEQKHIANLATDLRLAQDRIIAVEENLRAVGARPTAVAGSGAPGGAPALGGPAAPPPPSWERFLPDLQSKDEGIRVDAVIELGTTRDPKTLPHILPLLKDANLWVRMVAAEALGKLGDASAVPALIDALEDERTAVRENALFALQALTRETLRFDANGSEAERSKRVREWRDWWTKNRERLLGG